MKLSASFWVLTLLALSGLADAFGFFYASKIWREGSLSASDLARSAAGWVGGITAYVLALRQLSVIGVNSAEMQTIIWFATTIIGVVVLSGQFLSWPRLEQSVALAIVLALGWLLIRTSH